MYNWKIIQTKGDKKGKNKKLTYAACIGDLMEREFKDIANALIYEGKNSFTNSLNDFLRESKLAFEAEQRGEYYERKIERIDSASFKALQRKLNEGKEKDKQLEIKI
jgi:hypothetical protein